MTHFNPEKGDYKEMCGINATHKYLSGTFRDARYLWTLCLIFLYSLPFSGLKCCDIRLTDSPCVLRNDLPGYSSGMPLKGIFFERIFQKIV